MLRSRMTSVSTWPDAGDWAKLANVIQHQTQFISAVFNTVSPKDVLGLNISYAIILNLTLCMNMMMNIDQ